MQASHAPTKTPAATDEIGTRRHRLSTRSRTILIAIDGHHSVAQLQTMFASSGDVGLLLDELAGLGLVEGRAASVNKSAPPPASAAGTPALQRPASASALIEAEAASSTESPLMQVSQLMNQVAVESLGFRTFGFTLSRNTATARTNYATYCRCSCNQLRKRRTQRRPRNCNNASNA